MTVPLFYCPSCAGSGVKGGIVLVNSPEGLKDWQQLHPCPHCAGPERKMVILKRILIGAHREDSH
jgi:hypothetical protein